MAVATKQIENILFNVQLFKTKLIQQSR